MASDTVLLDVNDILNERETTHGSFIEQATLSQSFKAYLYHRNLTATQKEALEMIMHKVARIVCGNPNFQDHWDDIAGYATLVSRELAANPEKHYGLDL